MLTVSHVIKEDLKGVTAVKRYLPAGLPGEPTHTRFKNRETVLMSLC